MDSFDSRFMQRMFKVFHSQEMLFFLTILFCSQLCELKADIDIIVLDYQIIDADPEYVTDIETSVWENNVFMNFTILKYAPEDTTLRLQILGNTLGEYIVPTGFDVTMPLCEAMEDPILVGWTLKSMTPPIDSCPMKPETYTADFNFDDFFTDNNNFPDNFPPNQYLTKTTIFTPEKTLAVIECYSRMS